MQVVIPMSGSGERFRRAGYTVLKPLIEVNGRPIIGHVVDMFPGVDDFLFICNRDHLAEPAFRMEEILREICPSGRILPIEPHKRGPVHAVLAAGAAIDLSRPTVINYCDFTCYWSFEHFARYVAEVGCDGAIPAYTGFHPHMLGSVNYAYVRETNGWVEDIQEKKPFTDAPTREYASSGTYYFRTGAMALDYCRRCLEEGPDLNGEYYVSLVYKPMLEDGRGVVVYPLQHFMQWGTPEDLATYLGWARAFERLAADSSPRRRQPGAVMVPLAGAGSRFAKEGYVDPKPLVAVSGTPMVVQATRDLPAADRSIFILRSDLPGRGHIESCLSTFPGARLVVLDALTDGQARTCLLAIDRVDPEQPLTIGACDNGVLFDANRFETLMADPDVDVIVWVARHHPNAARRPEMYGWVETAGDVVTGVSVKKALQDPANDPIVIGTFTFKRARYFKAAAERMIERNGTVKGEYYVDTCINDAIAAGLRCHIIEVDAYLSWGTPDELRTFAYWQSCFHKWPRHPYRLENDCRVPESKRAELAASCRATVPPLPGPRLSRQEADVLAGRGTRATSASVRGGSIAPVRSIAQPALRAGRGPGLEWVNTEIGRFALVGLCTVAVDLAVYAAMLGMGCRIWIAKVIAFSWGALFAYVANKLFTFQSRNAVAWDLAPFVALYATTLCINVSVNSAVLALAGSGLYGKALAYGIAVGTSACANFIGMRMLFSSPLPERSV
jgi:putative flippase GtrA/NDP-sugar pyrophosphorylase family protein